MVKCQQCGQSADLAGLDAVPGGFGFTCATCGQVNLLAPVAMPSPPSEIPSPAPEPTSGHVDAPAAPVESTRPQDAPPPPGIVECPKCTHRQPVGDESCHRCGLKFALVATGQARLPGDPLAGNPSATLLRNQWSTLSQNLDDVQGHHAFIALCGETQALEFAGQCYRRLGDLDREDERIADYRQRVIQAALLRAGRMDQKAEHYAKSRLRGLLVLLFGALVILAFSVGYYLLTRYQVFWQHNG